MAAEPLTVRVTLDLVIDPETWDLIYGTGTSKSVLTREVRDYAQETFSQHHLVEAGAIISATEIHKR